MIRLTTAGILIGFLIPPAAHATPAGPSLSLSPLTGSFLTATEKNISETQAGPDEEAIADSVQSETRTVGTSLLIVDSDPDSAKILIDGRAIDSTTPHSFAPADSLHLVEVIKDGFEPLAEEVRLSQGETVKLKFLLKALPPAPITPEELGFEPAIQQPLLDERAADRLKTKFYGISLTFAIVPFGQGVLARTLLDDEEKSRGNLLIISGAALSLGSYALGRTLSSRKLSSIKRQNEIIKAQNDAAKEQNKEIADAVKAAYDEAIELWLEENADRGRVIVERQ